jgi:PilZ domain-containing protein
MPNVPEERRSSPRFPIVLAVEVVELPRGAKLSARASDVGRHGCYIDTLNPIPQGSQVRVRMTHSHEVFETLGRVVYVSPRMGMGVAFEDVSPEELAKLDRWLSSPNQEF